MTELDRDLCLTPALSPVLDVSPQPQTALTSLDGWRGEIRVAASIDAHDAARRQVQQLSDTSGVDQVIRVDRRSHQREGS